MRVRGQAQDVAPQDYVQLFVEAVADRLAERAEAWEAHGVTAPPLSELLDLFTDLLPAPGPSKLDAAIGPFYDTAAVTTVLGGISKQAVASRRSAGTILALRTADARWAYPTFQFAGADVDGRLLPAIRALRSSPQWSAALWFLTPNDALGEATPLDWARADQPGEPLLTSAHHAARSWS